MYKEKVKREVTPEAALFKLMALCSRGEKCVGDARRLLKRWEVGPADSDKIVDRLLQDRYIDQKRFCRAFVNDKSQYSGWGRYKIGSALRAKEVSKEDIEEALDSISNEESSQMLERLLRSKMAKTKFSTSYELKGKLLRFAASRGYGFEDAIEVIDCLVMDGQE